MMRRMRPRDLALLGFSLICLVAVAGPDYAGLGNRLEPRLFGLPFSLTWNLLWVAASFLALGLYHLVARGEDSE